MISKGAVYELIPLSLGKHHGGSSTEQKTAVYFMGEQKAEARNTGALLIFSLPPTVSGSQAYPYYLHSGWAFLLFSYCSLETSLVAPLAEISKV